jgi:hypothetical protein
MTHPGGGGGTGPGGGGGTGPGRTPTEADLPTLGMVIRKAEGYIAQALSVLAREMDPASEPTVLAWPAISEVRVHTVLLGKATADLRDAAECLGKVAAMDLPPAGSAVTTPDPGQKTRRLRLGPMPQDGPRHRHDPQRPGAPGLPPRPIDYPRPRLLG